MLRLPKSLDRLDDIARLVARHAKPTVALVAGGRLKYMTLSMNEVLGRVVRRGCDASLARQKSRVLFASRAAGRSALRNRVALISTRLDSMSWRGAESSPVRLSTSEPARCSRRSTRCRGSTPRSISDAGRASLPLQLKRRVHSPASSPRMIRTSRLVLRAIPSRRTASTLRSRHESFLETQPDESADLIVLNPPFHDGGPVSTACGAPNVLRREPQIAARRRTARRLEFTSWLPAGATNRRSGQQHELTRTPKFTVTASTKPVN